MLSSFRTDRLQSVGMNAKKRKWVSSGKGKGFGNLKEWGGLFIQKQKYEEGLCLECTHRNASLSQCFELNFLGTWKLFRKWRKHLFGCNIRPAIYLFLKERFRPRPNASGYAETTHLIFPSTRIRMIDTKTLLPYCAFSSTEQLGYSFLFQDFVTRARDVNFEFCCSYIVYRAQWPGLPLRCTTRHLFALDEPKIVFCEVENENVVHTFVSKLFLCVVRSHNLYEIESSSQEIVNCCRQNSEMYFNACDKTGDKSQQSCK